MQRAPAAAIVVLGLAGARGVASADHHHHGGEAPAGPRTWWAAVSVVMTAGAGHVRDASTDFLDETRAYQGAALAVAGGWRRLGARVALGGYHVGERGAGLDDLHAAVTGELTPRRGPVHAGVMAAAALPTGDADRGSGMGHPMVHGGAWAHYRYLDAGVAYARALGDGAEHAAHLHGGDGWPLVDPMNATEVAFDAGLSYPVVPGRLTVRAGALAAFPTERGVRRVVVSGGVRVDRGRLGAAATLARPVVGDPFTVRGQVEIGCRF